MACWSELWGSRDGVDFCFEARRASAPAIGVASSGEPKDHSKRISRAKSHALNEDIFGAGARPVPGAVNRLFREGAL